MKRDVFWAEPCAKPPFIPTTRRRQGAKRAGIAFETALAKALPDAIHGQWFKYADSHGVGWCQTDLLIFSPKVVTVVEVKLTDFESAKLQLEDLYVPVVAKAYPELEVRTVIALRHVTNVPREEEIFDSFTQVLMAEGPSPVFHWLGKGPIGP